MNQKIEIVVRSLTDDNVEIGSGLIDEHEKENALVNLLHRLGYGVTVKVRKMPLLKMALLDIPLEVIDTDGQGTRLLGSVTIGGKPHHVDLLAVDNTHERDEGPYTRQDPVDASYEEDYNRILELNGDGPLMTVRVDGFDYDYVVAVYPYAE